MVPFYVMMSRIRDTSVLFSAGLFITNIIGILLVLNVLSTNFGFVTVSVAHLLTIFLLLGVVLLNLPLRQTLRHLSKKNPHTIKLIIGSILCLFGFLLLIVSKTQLLWICSVPVILSGLDLCLQGRMTGHGFASSPQIPSDTIIQEGLQQIRTEQNLRKAPSELLVELEAWYNLRPLIDYATLIGTSITVKFIDGSYTVLMDPLLEKKGIMDEVKNPFIHERHGDGTSSTAVILNPAESMYGHYQCQRIIATLLKQDYSIEYLANQAVDVSYIKNNLSAAIIYMNTHAGYFDLDGDHVGDAVVIATGELWTNETEQKYAYEYQNHLIVKGMVGDQGIVAFTPAFIEQYYTQKQLPDSLVFMATCYALYDASMAQKFLDVGAAVYMGWSQNTVFWTNSKTSVQAFCLLSYGLTVQQVCNLIRSGGFYNWLFHSKLMYVGDGTYQIPQKNLL